MTKSPHYPVPGKDYPQTWTEFVDWFQDDTTCATFLERLRWPDEFVCPRCHEKTKPLRTTRGRFTCLECRHESTVTTGTIFHSTKTPLRTWFATVWYVTNQKQGTNALGLQRGCFCMMAHRPLAPYPVLLPPGQGFILLVHRAPTLRI